jgi:hypothetical protein
MLLKRLYQYQKERFPLAVHGLLIAAFSFSAIGYSRQLRHAAGFIPWQDYLLCVFSNLSLFFLLRVADEHKDKEDDARFRSYLPVPRGLISLRELRITGFAMLIPAIALIAWHAPAVLPLYLLSLGYLLLMRYEFFIAKWLRRNLTPYMLSHMLIIPLADIYASGYDWKLGGSAPGAGLLLFFGVSYCNGIVLEIARKLKAPEAEETGVDSYTSLWGFNNALFVWLAVLSLNCALATAAVLTAGVAGAVPVLIGFYLLALIPWIRFMRKPSPKASKIVEAVSLIWALAMYLTIGGIPQLLKL